MFLPLCRQLATPFRFSWRCSREFFQCTIDHFHKWRLIINSLESIKISLTNAILKLVIQKNFLSERGFIVYSNFSWSFLTKGERCNEVNPMWSTNPWNKARPQHREYHPLLFPISVCLTSPANHTTLKVSLQRQHVLLSYLKTLSVGPAEVWTCDLPYSSPVLYQLS